jgi:hypothetical protein
MYVIYDAENGLWLKSTCCGNEWSANPDEALTWATEDEAKAAAEAAGICSCWVTAK